MNVQEKSDCAVVTVNQPNNEGQQPSAEAREGRAQTEENIVQSHMRPTQSGKRMTIGSPNLANAASTSPDSNGRRMSRRVSIVVGNGWLHGLLMWPLHCAPDLRRLSW